MNQFTIRRNFHKIFGYENLFWANRLFFTLSQQRQNVCIYFSDFLTQLALIRKDDRVQNLSFLFTLLDVDGDRELTGSDLVEVKASMPRNCPFAVEFERVCNYFIDKNTLNEKTQEDRIKEQKGI